jgi:hypothetical protein
MLQIDVISSGMTTSEMETNKKGKKKVDIKFSARDAFL